MPRRTSHSLRVRPHLALVIAALSVAVQSFGCSRSDDRVTPPPSRESAETAKPLFDLKPSPPKADQGSVTPRTVPAAGNDHAATSGSGDRGVPAACPQLVDVAADAGLNFVYRTGTRGESLMVETMGGGCGVLDFDNDGHVDLFFNQGGDPTAPPTDATQPREAIFRGLPGGKFADVSVQALPDGPFHYGQGVAIGDYNDDGFDDIYLTNVGRNTLLRNQGDGTFVDVTDTAGVGDTHWSSSAAFADLTGDGLLDLYVCNYVDYDPRNPMDCRNREGQPRICHPQSVPAVPDECYVNLGDGTFRPEARQRGLFGEGNKALGVSVADFNLDGLPDIYVANDTTANFLFMNQGQGQFKEQALLLGCAVDRAGAFQASMGLAVGDYDGDGLLDIYSTHFHQESNTLYHNLGTRGFQDVTGFVGLHEVTLPRLGFGTVMQDFNQDGRQELFVTNGHIENYPDNPIHRMSPQLFSFTGERWTDCSARAGEFFSGQYVGRGVAMCDPDRDGAVGLVVVHQDTPAALLKNDSARGHWLKLEFRGRQSNRRGIGCQVNVRSPSRTWHQQLSGGGSYASSHQAALFFGLGEYSGPVDVEVRWPTGQIQSLTGVAIDRAMVIEEPLLTP